MAQCVVIDGSGFVVADPAPVESCTGFVLATPTEFAGLQTVFQGLSIADGAVLGTAIVTAWTIAFGFRVLGKMVWQSGQSEGESL